MRREEICLFTRRSRNAITQGPTTAGTYTITFAAPGYETQTVTDTLTPSGSDGCGYVTESLHQVSLIPIDAGTKDGG